MQIVLLSGGLGTRLRPLTNDRPKALVPARGRPFLEYQLRYLSHFGLKNVLILAGYKASMISDYLSAGGWQRVRLLDEGESLRGTGGALAWAAQQGALEEKFMVLYGDSFLPVDFGAMAAHWDQSGKKAWMSILRNQNAWDRSNVIFQEGRILRYEKVKEPGPEYQHIDYGFLGLRRDLFLQSGLPPVWDLADLLHRLSMKGDLDCYEVAQRFYEVGSHEGLAEFERLMSETKWVDFFDKAPSGQ